MFHFLFPQNYKRNITKDVNKPYSIVIMIGNNIHRLSVGKISRQVASRLNKSKSAVPFAEGVLSPQKLPALSQLHHQQVHTFASLSTVQRQQGHYSEFNNSTPALLVASAMFAAGLSASAASCESRISAPPMDNRGTLEVPLRVLDKPTVKKNKG